MSQSNNIVVIVYISQDIGVLKLVLLPFQLGDRGLVLFVYGMPFAIKILLQRILDGPGLHFKRRVMEPPDGLGHDRFQFARVKGFQRVQFDSPSP